MHEHPNPGVTKLIRNELTTRERGVHWYDDRPQPERIGQCASGTLPDTSFWHPSLVRHLFATVTQWGDLLP